VPDGDEWIVNGQKVWTSGGQVADMGMLLARTDPDVPKHQGITYFGIEMLQPGIEVRPLREMTGRALFNEVFLTDARVPDSARISDRGHGWAVANTTLGHERAGLGAGGGGAGEGALPGTVAGNLDKRAGDFVGARPARRGGTNGSNGKAAGDAKAKGGKVQAPSVPTSSGAKLLIDLAKGNGTISDATVRQDLVRLHTLSEIGKYNGLRVKAERMSGRDIPGMPNISKLSMSNILRLTRDLSLRIVGAYGTLHAYSDADRTALNAATGNPFLPAVTEAALFAQAPPIYGGTDQIQRNIIGERVLGLPKEPNNDKTAPFSSLPKNA
jgi:alkylation response protein AidB-like acyl-CoA dehydrogenase